MPYFKDLEPCTAFPGEWKNLQSVGWLAKGHEYPRGPVDLHLLQRMSQLGWHPPGASTAFHRCEFCGEGPPAHSETGAIFVPGEGVLYVAPRMIRHYIQKHGYQPPAQFLDAARTSPTDGLTFDAAIGRHFVRPAVEIEVLEGLEPVRRRPGMYIGGTDSRGLHGMLLEIVANSLDEYLVGAATRIAVDVDAQGWIKVEDDGRGMKAEFIETVFTALHTGATFDGHQPHIHLRSDAHGVGLAPVNALCAQLEVETRRDGVASRVGFARGRVVEPLRSLGATSERGTVIRFLPDAQIFPAEVRFELDALDRQLSTLAWLCPKLDILLQGRSLQRAEGLPGWVRALAPEVVQETMLSAIGTVNDVNVEVAFAWRPRSKEPLIRAFANYLETEEPMSSNRQGVISAVRSAIKQKRASREKKVLSGLVAVVHVGLLHPRFGGPTRARLEMKEAQVAVHQVVTRAINEAPWWWDRLHEAIG